MPNKIRKSPEAADSISPELLARARRREQLPAEIQAVLPRRRGPQRSPVKVPVTMRLSRDVVEALRSMGTGWQTHADEMLRRAVKRLPRHTSAK
jgi:uncharacterized protein (DUF4415 family)